MAHEIFYGKIWNPGDSLVVTIPSKIAKYGGYKKGDKVKIMMQKLEILDEDTKEDNPKKRKKQMEW